MQKPRYDRQQTILLTLLKNENRGEGNLNSSRYEFCPKRTLHVLQGSLCCHVKWESSVLRMMAQFKTQTPPVDGEMNIQTRFLEIKEG